MRSNKEGLPEDIDMDYVYELENNINKKRDTYQQAHYNRIESNVYPFQEGLIFLDLIHGMERIGDHIVNINESMSGIKLN